MSELVDHLIISRLLRSYGWEPRTVPYEDSHQGHIMGLITLTRERLLQAEPVSGFVGDDDRHGLDVSWHVGRVRHFYDRLVLGAALEPITVDNVCSGGKVYPQAVVVDGHHRLIAAKLFRAKTVPASYSGRVDLLDYLTGKRPKAPQE